MPQLPLPGTRPAPLLPPAGRPLPVAAVLLPALAGRIDAAEEALARGLAALPVEHHGPLLLAGARAALVAGQSARAGRRVAAARALGEPGAFGLAALLGLGTRAPPEGDPADVADAACDLAARQLVVDRPDRARAALDRAHQALPGHAETLRWQALLDGAPGPTTALWPHLALGGLSPWRLRRRLGGGLWGRATAPGSVERAAQDRGLLSRVLLGAAEPGPSLAEANPLLLPAETLVDALFEREQLGLPLGSLAPRCWALGRRLGTEERLRLAWWLAGLPSTEPELGPVQRATRNVLQELGLPLPSPRAVRSGPAQLLLATVAHGQAHGQAHGEARSEARGEARGEARMAGLSGAPWNAATTRPQASARCPAPA